MRKPLVLGIERTFRTDSEGILNFGRSQSLGNLLVDALRLLAAMSDELERDMALGYENDPI